MSFLFGRKSNLNHSNKEKETKFSQTTDLSDFDIGSQQPYNPFKDLILLPYFSSIVKYICILNDEKRLVIGDDDGNLTVWNETGNLLSNLKFHKGAITSIIKFNDSVKHSNHIAVSSNDKLSSIWNMDSYKMVRTTNLKSANTRLNMSINFNNNDFIIGSGIDIWLYDFDLNLVDELKRKKRENSVKHLISIKNDKFVVATNYDLEIYGLVYSLESDRESNKITHFYIKELKFLNNAHSDTILFLNKITETMFASSSANGILSLWHADHLIKITDLKPFDELNKNESMLKQNLTCISCFETFYERYIIICSGSHISIYDLSLNQYVCKISNAHGSKITDLVVLNHYLVTSSEDGSIRIWNFKESFYSNSNIDEPIKTEIKLDYVGECLGHSASVSQLKTLTRNEIISTGYDKLIIIWRNQLITDKLRKQIVNKILTNTMGQNF